MWMDNGIDENYDDFQEIAVSDSSENQITSLVRYVSMPKPEIRNFSSS